MFPRLNRHLHGIVRGILTGLLLAGGSAAAVGQNAGTPVSPATIAPTTLTAIKDAKVRERLNQELLLRGTISGYRTPTSDRAPHKMTLTDNTGSIQVAVWNDVWTQIPFSAKLQASEKLQVTLRAKMRLFRNEVEAHLGSALDIGEGDAIPAVAGPVAWLTSIPEALAQAQSQQKSLVVFFVSPTGESSNFVDQTVFGDRRVRELLASKYVPVRIDITQQPQVAQRLQVFRGGVVNIYGPDAQFRKGHQNLRRAEDLLRDLQ